MAEVEHYFRVDPPAVDCLEVDVKELPPPATTLQRILAKKRLPADLQFRIGGIPLRDGRRGTLLVHLQGNIMVIRTVNHPAVMVFVKCDSPHARMRCAELKWIETFSDADSPSGTDLLLVTVLLCKALSCSHIRLLDDATVALHPTYSEYEISLRLLLASDPLRRRTWYMKLGFLPVNRELHSYRQALDVLSEQRLHHLLRDMGKQSARSLSQRKPSSGATLHQLIAQLERRFCTGEIRSEMSAHALVTTFQRAVSQIPTDHSMKLLYELSKIVIERWVRTDRAPFALRKAFRVIQRTNCFELDLDTIDFAVDDMPSIPSARLPFRLLGLSGHSASDPASVELPCHPLPSAAYTRRPLCS